MAATYRRDADYIFNEDGLEAGDLGGASVSQASTFLAFFAGPSALSSRFFCISIICINISTLSGHFEALPGPLCTKSLSDKDFTWNFPTARRLQAVQGHPDAHGRALLPHALHHSARTQCGRGRGHAGGHRVHAGQVRSFPVKFAGEVGGGGNLHKS
jgi:hypothetical protein